MNYYLDTSVVAAVYLEDPISEKVQDFINRHRGTLHVSHWTSVELASAVNRLVNHEGLDPGEAREILGAYEQDLGVYFTPQPITLDAFTMAQAQLASFAAPLKGPDALHLGVIAHMQRRGLGTTILVTDDGQMARAASAYGLSAHRV